MKKKKNAHPGSLEYKQAALENNARAITNAKLKQKDYRVPYEQITSMFNELKPDSIANEMDKWSKGIKGGSWQGKAFAEAAKLVRKGLPPATALKPLRVGEAKNTDLAELAAESDYVPTANTPKMAETYLASIPFGEFNQLRKKLDGFDIYSDEDPYSHDTDVVDTGSVPQWLVGGAPRIDKKFVEESGISPSDLQESGIPMAIAEEIYIKAKELSEGGAHPSQAVMAAVKEYEADAVKDRQAQATPSKNLDEAAMAVQQGRRGARVNKQQAMAEQPKGPNHSAAPQGRPADALKELHAMLPQGGPEAKGVESMMGAVNSGQISMDEAMKQIRGHAMEFRNGTTSVPGMVPMMYNNGTSFVQGFNNGTGGASWFGNAYNWLFPNEPTYPNQAPQGGGSIPPMPAQGGFFSNLFAPKDLSQTQIGGSYAPSEYTSPVAPGTQIQGGFGQNPAAVNYTPTYGVNGDGSDDLYKTMDDSSLMVIANQGNDRAHQELMNRQGTNNAHYSQNPTVQGDDTLFAQPVPQGQPFVVGPNTAPENVKGGMANPGVAAGAPMNAPGYTGQGIVGGGMSPSDGTEGLPHEAWMTMPEGDLIALAQQGNKKAQAYVAQRSASGGSGQTLVDTSAIDPRMTGNVNAYGVNPDTNPNVGVAETNGLINQAMGAPGRTEMSSMATPMDTLSQRLIQHFGDDSSRGQYLQLRRQDMSHEQAMRTIQQGLSAVNTNVNGSDDFVSSDLVKNTTNRVNDANKRLTNIDAQIADVQATMEGKNDDYGSSFLTNQQKKLDALLVKRDDYVFEAEKANAKLSEVQERQELAQQQKENNSLNTTKTIVDGEGNETVVGDTTNTDVETITETGSTVETTGNTDTATTTITGDTGSATVDDQGGIVVNDLLYKPRTDGKWVSADGRVLGALTEADTKPLQSLSQGLSGLLGFEAGDLQRAIAMYAVGRLMGVSSGNAAKFAGNAVLKQVDARLARKNELEDRNYEDNEIGRKITQLDELKAGGKITPEQHSAAINALTTYKPEGTGSGSEIFADTYRAPNGDYYYKEKDGAGYVGPGGQRVNTLPQGTVKTGTQGADLPTGVQTTINTLHTESSDAEINAARIDGILADLKSAGGNEGLPGKITEWAKGILGAEGDVSVWKTQWTELKNGIAIGGLPPGVASDKDIELVMAGFPDANWDKEALSKWMKGYQKILRYKSSYGYAKADWQERNRGRLTGFSEYWKATPTYKAWSDRFEPITQDSQGNNQGSGSNNTTYDFSQ